MGTSISLRKVLPQIEQILKHKIPIVSTAEELAFPVTSHRGLAKKIDALARRARVAVLGTGLHPGLAMDALPKVLTAPPGLRSMTDMVPPGFVGG